MVCTGSPGQCALPQLWGHAGGEGEGTMTDDDRLAKIRVRLADCYYTQDDTFGDDCQRQAALGLTKEGE